MCFRILGNTHILLHLLNQVLVLGIEGSDAIHTLLKSLYLVRSLANRGSYQTIVLMCSNSYMIFIDISWIAKILPARIVLTFFKQKKFETYLLKFFTLPMYCCLLQAPTRSLAHVIH